LVLDFVNAGRNTCAFVGVSIWNWDLSNRFDVNNNPDIIPPLKLIKIKGYKMIKHSSQIILLSAMVVTSALHADTFLGSDIEVGVWSPNYDAGSLGSNISGDDKLKFASATLEHPLPVLPNLKVSLSNVKSDKYKYTKIDLTAFYEVLDNDAVSIDLGLGASKYKDGEYNGQAFTGTIPHVYVDAEVAIPLISTTAYTDIHYMNYDGSAVTDAIAGLRYDFNLVAADLGVKAGYRVQSVDTDNLGSLSFDVKTDGYFVGLHADF